MGESGTAVLGQANPGPIGKPLPLTAGPRRLGRPGVRRQLRDQVIGTSLHTTVPNHMGTGDRQHIRMTVDLQPPAQIGRIAIDLVGGDPASHAGTPAVNARSSIAWANAGLVAKVIVSGIPASRRRA